VGLILWSAASLRARLADLSITRDRLDAALYEVSVQVTGYGNISTMVTLLFVAAATALLHPGLTTPAERDRAGHTVAAAPRSEPVEHPAAPAHSAPVESRTANSAELQ
jgi:hypothetical protein